MFYDTFLRLCKNKGETPSMAAKNIGLSNATASGWKQGAIPNDITLQRVASYFNVSVEEISGTSPFYSNFVKLCNSIKKAPSKVVLEIGLQKSSVTRWKSGSIPTDATAQKIADYFGVSVSELTAEPKKAPTPKDEREPDITQAKIALFGGDGEVTDEMWDEAVFAAQLIKERHKRKKGNE